MSIPSSKYEKSSRQPAILSRKRKAESEFEVTSSSSEFSSPLSCNSHIKSSCEDTPSTDTDTEEHKPHAFSEFRGLTTTTMKTFSYTCRRACPLPNLDWAEEKELWHSMVLKDTLYRRDSEVLQRHPELEPRMRAILLDWLTEVCEVYRLHRETFYLAQDYIDRFLTEKPNLPRNSLQLLGATALFVASKMEEIYPPKLEQFAFVTDGACTEGEILAQELILIMTLNWNLTPVTINCWLNTFMQLAYIEDGENLIGPGKYPPNLFVQLSQVLDLCILDLESLKYPYSVLSASAIAHLVSKDIATHVSGLSWSELLPCVSFMKPYVEVVSENAGAHIKNFSDVPTDDWHHIQSHTAGLKLLDQVHQKKRLLEQESSPSFRIRELTPPLSSKKNKMNVN
ncbi:G1/S-specific cyclin-E1-like [Uloborus diversus]|uniref:G1/S-specific cyclin-E1-like n=1 Tax=Uloborus diversus TaxID=327109 RepID=UPI00240A8C39|nr:G1/S-specific cyclin-E1-like [Uloborus diversus]